MLERSYNADQKRALNVIWNAAEDYQLIPPFMAFQEDGQIDFYWNLIIGLCLKWLDRRQISKFFLSYSGARLRSSYDRLVWLTLENWLYNKERPFRPILPTLREEAARAFIRQMPKVSRQKMMLDRRAYEQEWDRWASLAGEKRPHLSAKAKKLSQLLAYADNQADSEEVIDHLTRVLVEGMGFSNFRIDGRQGGEVSGSMRSLLDQLLRHEVRHTDSLLTRNEIEGQAPSPDGQGPWRNKDVSGIEEGDREYILACFGPCILPDPTMQQLEKNLCRSNHEYCKLWVAGRKTGTSHLKLKEAVLVDQQSRQQEQKNHAYYERQKQMIASSVRKLSANIKTILASYLLPLPVQSKSGKLQAEKAYRMDILQDPDIFLKAGDEVENDLAVDILLDGSASRMPYQEQIASQAYILAKSLSQVHIPVRISDFHSLRGYTVLRILKDYESSDLEGIFQYYAAGWNRDGLALRCAERLMKKGSREEKRILLIMTDANPSDSTKMPPEPGRFFDRSYANLEGLQDVRDAVKEMRAEQIDVGAVYTGPNLYLKNVKSIYGSRFVRVQNIHRLAEKVSSLLLTILRSMKN